MCQEFTLNSKPLYSSHEFSAMGFIEVLPLIFKAKEAIKKLVNLSFTQKINGILCIDSPAFNIPFAKALKKQAVKFHAFIISCLKFGRGKRSHTYHRKSF